MAAVPEEDAPAAGADAEDARAVDAAAGADAPADMADRLNSEDLADAADAVEDASAEDAVEDAPAPAEDRTTPCNLSWHFASSNFGKMI